LLELISAKIQLFQIINKGKFAEQISSCQNLCCPAIAHIEYFQFMPMCPCYESYYDLKPVSLEIIVAEIKIHDILAVVQNFNYQLRGMSAAKSVATDVQADQTGVLDDSVGKTFEAFVAHLAAKHV